MLDYVCEFCHEGGDRYDMATLEPIVECVDCAEKVADWWYRQYRADRRDVDLDGGYDESDPKHPSWADRQFEKVDAL